MAEPDRGARPPIPGFPRDGALYDLGAGAGWEVDLFGGLRRGEEAAEAEAQAAEAARLGVRVTVAADAADAYLHARGDQARLKVAEQQVATDRRLLDLVRLRKAQGMATDRETAQAEALLAQARGAVPLLRAALDAQTNRLAVLMGAQPGASVAELSDAAALPAIPRITATPPTCAGGPTSSPPSAIWRRRRAHRRGDRRILPQAVAVRRGRLRSDRSRRACSRAAPSSRWRPPACAGGCSTSAASTPKWRRPTPPAAKR